MLSGSSIRLRLVRQNDMEELYARHVELSNRGRYFPLGVVSETTFQKRFHDNGFWSKDEGMLLIEDDDLGIAGHIEYFKTVSYLDELELSYQLYDPAVSGRGYVTEAVNLLTNYLFRVQKINRIRLVIHPDNLASRRIAEKCGFSHEGTSRGAWYHEGRNQDVEIYAIIREDVIPATP